jgi:hypothetical protein
MATENQIRANQENAMHSTGPRTEEGKAIASQNSRQHGLSSKTLHVTADRRDEFLDLYATFHEHIKPIGELQMEQFERLIHAKWNANLARELHATGQAQQDDKKIASAIRYLNNWERAYDKALKALRAEQADLALRAIPQNEPIADLPPSMPIAKIANEATKLARLHERTQWRSARLAILSSIGDAFREVTVPNAAPDREDHPIDLAA